MTRVVAVLIYSQIGLGLVMTGASVLLTFVTDGMGFFLFLGLARVFLV